MSVAVEQGCIRLSGVVPVEEAEPLLVALIEHGDFPVDVRGLERAHSSVVQLLHAAGRRLVGAPADVFLRDFALRDLIELGGQRAGGG